MQESEQTSSAQAPESAPDLGATLLRVAWLAVILGLVMEVLLLALGGALGDALGLKPPAADLFVEGINEVLFPVGCSVVLFSAGALGKKTARRSRR